MPTPVPPLYETVTLIDVKLASAYYPILVDLARHKYCLTYGGLVQRAKDEYPKNNIVQNAIPVSTGRRLDVVRMFTSERDMPDLTSLVISKGSGECGPGFRRNFDPVTAREAVFAFDWSDVTMDFDGFIDHTEQAIKPRRTVSKGVALKLMSDYNLRHRSTLPADIRERREEIIDLIMEGFTQEEAFQMVQQAI
ncbi:Uncharacterized protein ALO42_04186 [Pseudomonas syringae pv. atrofaciens]|uniref:Uncharacterized protein n=1 Tax=Pseudomonas syringae pv. atrofaciens TaxID=192087 RepID=A0AAD0N052_PSESX|nr:hypothetical protein [Pseudomonas syringae]AVX26346.1 hypothetical protein DA456_24770 [Pseudomonas syringae pv. atrofaciens]KPW09590.1 Uncharacterized protein ALO42_04186 [Pseudomonas syringae pv. atrofaciens]MDF5830832.1 hypothetical protein [Pseudomonas syringae]